MIMFDVQFVAVMFLSHLVLTTSKFYYETDTRIIIVTDEKPKDGHLRLYRSAIARNLEPVILKKNNEEPQIQQIQNYLNAISYKPNEITVLTSSDHYLATNDASSLGLNVARVSLSRGGNVVMAYPMDRHFEGFSTPVDADVAYVANELKSYESRVQEPMKDIKKNGIKEWRELSKLSTTQRRLLVKQRHHQFRKASVYDQRYCALAGLTHAIKDVFEKIAYHPDLSSMRSMKNLCSVLASNTSLLYHMKIVKDYEGYVFKRSPEVIENMALMKDPNAKDEANHLYSSEFSFQPFLFGPPELLPFLISNFASGDTVVPPSQREDFIDQKISDLNQHFHGKLPEVHVVAVTTPETSSNNISDFFNHLSTLIYPRLKIKLHIVSQVLNENDQDDIQNAIVSFQNNNSTAFNWITAISVPEANVNAVYEKAWRIMQKIKSNYACLIHSSVILSNPSVIEDLLRINRRVVSPMLKGDDHFNFKTERARKLLKENMFALPFQLHFQDKRENISMVGLLHVPYVYGILFLRRDVVTDLNLHFNLCPKDCEEGEDDCFKRHGDLVNCENNYYENLRDDPNEMVWGMISKNIIEQGYMIHLTNEKEYGTIINQKEH